MNDVLRAQGDAEVEVVAIVGITGLAAVLGLGVADFLVGQLVDLLSHYRTPASVVGVALALTIGFHPLAWVRPGSVLEPPSRAVLYARLVEVLVSFDLPSYCSTMHPPMQHDTCIKPL